MSKRQTRRIKKYMKLSRTKRHQLRQTLEFFWKLILCVLFILAVHLMLTGELIWVLYMIVDSIVGLIIDIWINSKLGIAPLNIAQCLI